MAPTIVSPASERGRRGGDILVGGGRPDRCLDGADGDHGPEAISYEQSCAGHRDAEDGQGAEQAQTLERSYARGLPDIGFRPVRGCLGRPVGPGVLMSFAAFGSGWPGNRERLGR
jgi:hypothetical protein